MRRNNHASIGIGTMITFIAIILVSALVSMTIIVTLEKAFKEQSHAAEASEEKGKIIVDSIYIYRFQPCWVTDYVPEVYDPDCSTAPAGRQAPWGYHQLLMNFHLAPGSTDISITNANYIIRCIDEGVTDLDNDGFNGGDDRRIVQDPILASSFSGSSLTTQLAVGANDNAFERGFPSRLDENLRINTLTYGEAYKIKLDMFDHKNTVAVEDNIGCRISEDYDSKLLITLGGGSATEFTLHFRSLEAGQLVL